MKHSQTTGFIAALALIVICFMPWSYVVSQNIVISGMNTTGTSFGRPGLLNIIFAVLSIIFFSIPKIWAKRTNIFICMLNFAWGIKNYVLVTTCAMGDCPQKRAGVYLLLLVCLVMMLMSFLPRLEIKK